MNMRIHFAFTLIMAFSPIESVKASILPNGCEIGRKGYSRRRVRGVRKEEYINQHYPHSIRSLKKGSSKSPKKEAKFMEIVDTTDLGKLSLDWWDWAVCSEPWAFNKPECQSQEGVPEGWNFLATGDDETIYERSCTLEKGKTILLPIVNTIWWDEDVDCDGLGLYGRQCADAVKATCDSFVAEVNAALDGTPMAVQVISSPVVREFKSRRCEETNVLVGLKYVYGCGWWVVLPPFLEGGTHELFVAGNLDCGCDELYETNFTHTIMVK